MRDIKVLVTDDSAVIRRLVADVINNEPGLSVVGIAENGRRAVELANELRPDVVTLDVEMPVMNGLEAVAALRREHPRLPIVMFSTLTVEGGAATLEALSLGASDFVAKPSGPGGLTGARAQVRGSLIPKLLALGARAARVSPGAPGLPAVRPRGASPAPRQAQRVDCVVVAVSTGGPRALEDIVPAIPREIGVPILVVQHMPPTFTRLLAERLDRAANVHVREAVAGEPVLAGNVYIAPGGRHLEVARVGTKVVTVLNDAPPEHSCRPSADPLFRSAVAVFGSHVCGFVLTGMGTDGSGGAQAIADAGGLVIAQDEETSVVWGMPGTVVRAGLAQRVLPLAEVVPELVRRTAIGRPAVRPTVRPAELRARTS